MTSWPTCGEKLRANSCNFINHIWIHFIRAAADEAEEQVASRCCIRLELTLKKKWKQRFKVKTVKGKVKNKAADEATEQQQASRWWITLQLTPFWSKLAETQRGCIVGKKSGNLEPGSRLFSGQSWHQQRGIEATQQVLQCMFAAVGILDSYPMTYWTS